MPPLNLQLSRRAKKVRTNRKNDKKRKQVIARNYPDVSQKIYITVDTEDFHEQQKELDRLRSNIEELNKRYDTSRLYSERLYEVALRKSAIQLLKVIERNKDQSESAGAELG